MPNNKTLKVYFFFKNIYLPPLNQSCVTDEKEKAINHKISAPSAHSIGKKMVFLFPKECIIKKSVRCILNVHPHTQTTTATTKRGKWSKRDCNGDLCTSCRKPGPFNILVASLQEADAYLLMKPLCSYEVFHFSQSLYDFLRNPSG